MLTRNDYQEAIDAQCACNLSGIVHSFSRVITKIWEEAHANGYGTDWVNHHPICVFYAEQICWLAGNGSAAGSAYHNADTAIRKAIQDFDTGVLNGP